VLLKLCKSHCTVEEERRDTSGFIKCVSDHSDLALLTCTTDLWRLLLTIRHVCDYIYHILSSSGLPSTRKILACWSESSREPPSWLGLEHLAEDEGLRQLDLFSLEKER